MTMTRGARWTLALLLAAVVALQVRSAWIGLPDHDEIEHLHAAWLVSEGLRPYADFFEHHQAPLWYALAPLAGTADPLDLVPLARLAMLAFLAGTVLLAARMGADLSGSRSAGALGALVLTGTWVFLRTGMEVRPDGPMVFFEALALERFFAWTRRPRWTTALAAGLAAGVAVALLHKAVAIVPGLLAGVIVSVATDRDVTRGRRLVHLAVATAACAAPVAALYGALAAMGILGDALFFSFDFTAAIQMGTSLSLHFAPFQGLASVFTNSPGLFLVGVPGLLLVFARLRDPRSAALAVSVLATCAFVALSEMPFKQFYQPLWVFLGVAAALAFRRVEERSVGPRAAWIRAVGPVVAGVSLVLAGAGLFVAGTSAVTRAVSGRLLEVTAPADPVLAQPPWHPIARRDAGFLWFNIREYLGALDQMEKAGRDVGPDRARRMRDVLARPPAAVFVGANADLKGIPGLGAWVSERMRPDDLVRNLFVRYDPAPRGTPGDPPEPQTEDRGP